LLRNQPLGDWILTVISHLPGMWKTAGLHAQTCSHLWLSALLLPFLLFLTPATARGDIYKWIDEHGNPVISNVLPANPNKVTKMSLVAKEWIKPAAPMPVASSQNVATPVVQLLLDKIDRLEQRLQTPPNPPRAGMAPPQSYYGSYDTAPPPPASYYPSYYPIDYSAYYYPWVPLYSYAVYPARTFAHRPTFAMSHHVSIRNGSLHRGGR
jgi:hypothetical protein